jgi:hypothetical protein
MAQSIEDILELDKQISQFKQVGERLFRFMEGTIEIPKNINLSGLNIYDMFRKKFKDYITRHLKPKLMEQLKKNSDNLVKKYTFFKAVLSNLKRLRKTVLSFCSEIEIILGNDRTISFETLSFSESVRLRGNSNENLDLHELLHKISKILF